MTKDDLELYLYRWRYGPDSELTAYDVVDYMWPLLFPVGEPAKEAKSTAIDIKNEIEYDHKNALFTWYCGCGWPIKAWALKPH